MAWTVMYDVMQWVDANGDPASGYVLKAYLPGTTTPTSIAIDKDGSSPQATITFNAEGKPEVSGNEIVPFIDREYKWAIFRNASDASANSNPFAGFYDNIPQYVRADDAAAIYPTFNELTTTTMKNHTNRDYIVGDVIQTAEYSTGNGGGGIYDTVLTSSVTPNGYNIIQSVANPLISFALRVNEQTTPRQYGASPAASAATNAGAIQAWFSSQFKFLKGSAGSYTVNASLVSAVEDRIIDGDMMEIICDSSVTTQLLELQADSQIVERFQFKAVSSEATGIFIGAYNNCEIRFNKFTDFDGNSGTDKGSAIVANSLGEGHWIHHNRVIDCKFSHAAKQYGSIHCNAKASIIEHNRITDAEQTCVSVAGGSGQGGNYTAIRNNYMVGKSGAADSGGVNIDGYTVGVNISGNHIRQMGVEGILIAGSVGTYGTITSDFTISNNDFHECVLNEIALQGSATGDVVRGLIFGNKGYRSTNTNQALVMTSCDDVDIFSNQFYGHATGYIITAACKRHNVSGNTFINQSNTGIQAAASESIYTNNRVWGNAANIGIAFNAVTLAGKLSIHGNAVRNCLTGISGTFNAALPVYINDNNLGGNTTNLSYTGELADSSRDNNSDTTLAGEATLAAGTVTVNTTQVVAGDRIEIQTKTPAGTKGALYINSITAGAGFVVNSTNAADTSTIYWRIVR